MPLLVNARALDLSLYGGNDPRNEPRYTYPEAARATGVPVSTIAAWVRGMPYTRPHKGDRGFVEPVIERPDPEDTRLSFNNLLEAHVLRALRQAPEVVQLSKVREAIKQAQEEHGIDRLLIDPKLRSSGGDLFLDYYIQLVELSKSRQYAMRSILQQYLTRIEVDEDVHRATFFPIPKNPQHSAEKLVRVSPFVAFGNPIIGHIGASTQAIAERYNVGEEASSIMRDYDLTEDEFDEALSYEAAA